MKIAELKILVASALLFMTASAQALQPEVLYGFQLGARTPSTLVQGDDGKFYGTTWYARNGGYGKVFTVTTNGVLTWLASFPGDSDNLVTPVTGLVLGRDGHFCGTTPDGGSNRNGTVFRVTTNGALTTLVSFSGTNGSTPRARLVLGNDGNFYGTTSGWGGSGNGTVFKVTTTGALTTLVSFSHTNGAHPEAELALGNDGDFYGTTAYGGSGAGTVFKVTTNGV